MSSVEARADEIAKRYGSVLFELIKAKKELKTVLKDVTQLRKSLQADPQSWAHVVSPVILPQTQRRIVENIAISLNLGSLVTRFLIVLSQNRRLKNLNSILDAFLTQVQAAEGIIEGTLETATEFSKKEIETLQQSLKLQTEREILLRQEVKSTLLGGVVLRIGSMMIDASTKTQLNKLRQAMER